jgi:hypothetical protein
MQVPLAGDHRPSPVERLAGLIVYLPVLGFVVDFVIRLVGGTDDWQSEALESALIWLVGVNGVMLASGHLLDPGRTAARIGWPMSPFQFEVGLTNLLLGVLGLMAGWFDRDFWLATIVAFSVYMLGAAAGHVRSMVRERNFAPGNAGYIFWYDVLVPVLLIVLYVVTG